MEDKSQKRLSRNVSFENENAYMEWKVSNANNGGAASPEERLSRQHTNISSEEMSEQELEDAMAGGGSGLEAAEEEEEEDGEEVEDDDEDEYDEDEDEDDEDEDEDLQPPSQYISALDLAGF